MTETEAALQQAIDAAPLTGVRLILADHLEEQGDKRAEGYRALEWLGLWPCHLRPPFDLWDGHWMYQLLPRQEGTRYARADSYTFDSDRREWVNWFRIFCPGVYSSHWDSRREADDAAALGWARLEPADRAALMGQFQTG